ncbi:hypothetical protein ALNOE001_06700 [Candidatus Methanobinarius endosymbioticus]|uniref:Right handed beta helix domain-containing protein n=1 Tax=Candidatus Methanobinarius endosymbioticus TaxID=2006182 RepID=A0A366MC15_9EURY|nr:hypothetical protein ALNOE001_06700 [Candidatus Methanobinarius endosymbioticus]
MVNNTCNINNGGAIISGGNNLRVIDSNFTNNIAVSSSETIYSRGVNSSFTNLNFVNNSASSVGAISIHGDNSSVINSAFI